MLSWITIIFLNKSKFHIGTFKMHYVYLIKTLYVFIYIHIYSNGNVGRVLFGFFVCPFSFLFRLLLLLLFYIKD